MYTIITGSSRGARLGINHLQTRFLVCVASIKGDVSRLNIFKNHMDGQMHAMGKFILELGKSISGARRLSRILHEARPYFRRDGPMGSEHMLLQLANATVDLRQNTIRNSMPGDYLIKGSAVVVPDCVLGWRRQRAARGLRDEGVGV